MSERIYRLVLGGTLFLALYYKLDYLVYGFTGVLLFEGLSNIRLPGVISLIRYGKPPHEETTIKINKYNFEAERLFRIVLALILGITYALIPEQAWFFPWFIGFMLIFAGITNMCPMMIALRSLGFK